MAAVDELTRRAPPHNLEAEQSVLGAILLSDRTIYGLVIEEGLRPDDFYRDQHRLVYEAMLELYNDGGSIDKLTVTERLRQSGKLDEVGGEAAVHELAAAVPAAGNARHYAQIVKDNALLRRLLTTTYEIQAWVPGHEAPPRDLVERAERAMLEVAHDDRQKDFRSIDEVLHAELDKLQKLSREGTSLTGTPSGFKDLDELTGGFQPGNLIVIAARPSMGKSRRSSRTSPRTRRSSTAAASRCSRSRCPSPSSPSASSPRRRASRATSLRKGRVAANRWPKILEASQRLAEAPLYIDDSSDVGMLEIRAKARRLHQPGPAGGLGLIIVDYLQLMRADGRSRTASSRSAR